MHHLKVLELFVIDIKVKYALIGTGMEEFKVEIEEIGDVLIQIDSDHNYYMKQEITDSISISSDGGEDENKLDLHCKELECFKSENEVNNDSTSLLQTAFEEASLLFQSDLEEKIILEISNPSVDLEFAVKNEFESINIHDNFTCSICSLE